MRGGRGGHYGGGRNSTVEFVSNICEGDTPTTCDFPPHGGSGGGYPGEESAVVSTSGIFVCRIRTNPNTQEVDTFSVCIPEDKGIAVMMFVLNPVNAPATSWIVMEIPRWMRMEMPLWVLSSQSREWMTISAFPHRLRRTWWNAATAL